MARLPVPGSDNNVWGDLLNDYLSVAHAADGTLKNSAVALANIAAANVPSDGQVLAKNGNNLNWQNTVTSVDGQSNAVALTGKYIKTPAAFCHDAWAGKPNGPLSGTTLDSGQTWQVSGTQLPRVRSGRMTLPAATTGACYAQVNLGSALWQIGAEFVFESGSTSSGGATLLVANDASMDLSNLACHLTVTVSNWVYEVRQNSGSLVILASGAFATHLVANGQTVYRMSVSIIGSTAYVSLPDGAVAVVSDNRIASFNSGAAMWESLTAASTDNIAAFTRVWATTTPDAEVPFTVDTAWIRAVNRMASRVLDANQYNVTSQRGTANEVTMGDLGGFSGIRFGGDALMYRVGANTLSINSVLLLAGVTAHTGSALGFYGAPVTARPSLTYSRTGESAAEAQLRTALATLGLVADNTTA